MDQSRARLSLTGLSVGDAFGQTFFTSHDEILRSVRTRIPARGPWRWTDDTAMAISIVEELLASGSIDQNRLARRFAARYADDPTRGYGAGAAALLERIARGESWPRAASKLFGGAGSFGNGAAMRVAPVGAFFGADIDADVEQARRSAAVTHAHAEGVAGAIAIAVAAAVAATDADNPFDRDRFFGTILARTPHGYTHEGIEEAARLDRETDVVSAAVALGNGSSVSALDTVPFVLWSVAAAPDDLEEALWRTAMALGDVDTTCAMVGGIGILRTGIAGLPSDWLEATEPLPTLEP